MKMNEIKKIEKFDLEVLKVVFEVGYFTEYGVWNDTVWFLNNKELIERVNKLSEEELKERSDRAKDLLSMIEEVVGEQSFFIGKSW